MAAIRWKIRKVKKGIRVQADVVMPCGTPMSEYAVSRTEEIGRSAVSVLLADRVKDHKKRCTKGC